MNVTYQNALINLKRFIYYFKTSKRQKDRLCIKLRFLFEFQLQYCVSYQRLVTSHCKTLIYKFSYILYGKEYNRNKKKIYEYIYSLFLLFIAGYGQESNIKIATQNISYTFAIVEKVV